MSDFKKSLTDEDAVVIRHYCRTPGWSHEDIAELFGVSSRVIRDIARGRTYQPSLTE